MYLLSVYPSQNCFQWKAKNQTGFSIYGNAYDKGEGFCLSLEDLSNLSLPSSSIIQESLFFIKDLSLKERLRY